MSKDLKLRPYGHKRQLLIGIRAVESVCAVGAWNCNNAKSTNEKARENCGSPPIDFCRRLLAAANCLIGPSREGAFLHDLFRKVCRTAAADANAAASTKASGKDTAIAK